MNRRPIFFTGTGTDIGKTHVLCALLEIYRSVGGRARVLKPVLSGFDNAAVSASDTARLLAANGDVLSAKTVKATTPWRLRSPLISWKRAPIFTKGLASAERAITHPSLLLSTTMGVRCKSGLNTRSQLA